MNTDSGDGVHMPRQRKAVIAGVDHVENIMAGAREKEAAMEAAGERDR